MSQPCESDAPIYRLRRCCAATMQQPKHQPPTPLILQRTCKSPTTIPLEFPPSTPIHASNLPPPLPPRPRPLRQHLLLPQRRHLTRRPLLPRPPRNSMLRHPRRMPLQRPLRPHGYQHHRRRLRARHMHRPLVVESTVSTAMPAEPRYAERRALARI